MMLPAVSMPYGFPPTGAPPVGLPPAPAGFGNFGATPGFGPDGCPVPMGLPPMFGLQAPASLLAPQLPPMSSLQMPQVGVPMELQQDLAAKERQIQEMTQYAEILRQTLQAEKAASAPGVDADTATASVEHRSTHETLIALAAEGALLSDEATKSAEVARQLNAWFVENAAKMRMEERNSPSAYLEATTAEVQQLLECLQPRWEQILSLLGDSPSTATKLPACSATSHTATQGPDISPSRPSWTPDPIPQRQPSWVPEARQADAVVAMPARVLGVYTAPTSSEAVMRPEGHPSWVPSGHHTADASITRSTRVLNTYTATAVDASTSKPSWTGHPLPSREGRPSWTPEPRQIDVPPVKPARVLGIHPMPAAKAHTLETRPGKDGVPSWTPDARQAEQGPRPQPARILGTLAIQTADHAGVTGLTSRAGNRIVQS